MIIDLFWIVLFVALVFESGFWDSMDGYISKRFKFHHLPHLLMCQLCQTWWLCLLYIIVTGNLSLMNIAVCLLMANLGEIVLPLFKLMKGTVMAAIQWLVSKIY